MPHFRLLCDVHLLRFSSLFACTCPARRGSAPDLSELVGPIWLEGLLIVSSTCAVCGGLSSDCQLCWSCSACDGDQLKRNGQQQMDFDCFHHLLLSPNCCLISASLSCFMIANKEYQRIGPAGSHHSYFSCDACQPALTPFHRFQLVLPQPCTSRADLRLI